MKSFFGINGAFFVRFSRKRQDESAPKFFQGLGENTLFIQLALNSNALGHGIM